MAKIKISHRSKNTITNLFFDQILAKIKIKIYIILTSFLWLILWPIKYYINLFSSFATIDIKTSLSSSIKWSSASIENIFTFIICKHIIFDQFSKFLCHFISSQSAFVPFYLCPDEILHWRFASKMLIIVIIIEINFNEFHTVPRRSQFSTFIIADNGEMLGGKN